MYKPARHNPSFSSSLLDEIYRSIDQRNDQEVPKYRNTSFNTNSQIRHEIQDKVTKRSSQRDLRCFNSSSSSSGSSCTGFSSSEADSVYCVSIKPNSIRTSTHQHDDYNKRESHDNMYGQRYQHDDIQSKQKHEGIVKTKSRAMKIYGDLKKVKQPISPGGRLATFLNSIFTTKNMKSSSDEASVSKSTNASTCSSASAYSRSCLSKTPSSRGKLSSNKKRSVRFYPVSVIVDEDCQPCGHKSLYGEQSDPKTIKFVQNRDIEEYDVRSSEKTRRIEEAARNLLRNYQKKVDLITSKTKSENEIEMNYEDDENDDDDASSSTSSDLFELENLSAIGMGKYGDELPVYETTHLDTNLAIGNGFLI
ncbi:protein BIG GRAIN 1-like A [Rutidosis leptorrhynchoides]|uniref:protein BIG GRAIN 1-like A n=1 Tax=Rutidosis leptorrhynchoides TaxID=125765 RepID=UPI003A9A63E6